MINSDMVQQWAEHHHKILKYELNIHKNIHVEILGGHHGLKIGNIHHGEGPLLFVPPPTSIVKKG